MTGDFDVAEYADRSTELKDLLGLDSRCLERLKGRAQFFIEGGQHERALVVLEMLEELDGADPLPTLLAIDSLLALGHSGAAAAKVRALLDRNPGDADAQVALAEVQIAAGQMALAAGTLARVIRDDPEACTDAGGRALAVAALTSVRLGDS